MRIIVGLDAPTSGRVVIGGRRYGEIIWPLHQVGSLLDANALHPGRSAWCHLRSAAESNGIGKRRVSEVLQLTGVEAVARRRVATFSVATFSLGMKQRLGIALALLGDPPVLLFDEPGNGLDPEGVHWLRQLFKTLAAEDRTVFVSSHLMNEMALTAVTSPASAATGCSPTPPSTASLRQTPAPTSWSAPRKPTPSSNCLPPTTPRSAGG